MWRSILDSKGHSKILKDTKVAYNSHELPTTRLYRYLVETFQYRVKLNALQSFTSCTPMRQNFLECTDFYSKYFGVYIILCTPFILLSWSSQQRTPKFLECAPRAHQNIGVHLVYTIPFTGFGVDQVWILLLLKFQHPSHLIPDHSPSKLY